MGNPADIDGRRGLPRLGGILPKAPDSRHAVRRALAASLFFVIAVSSWAATAAPGDAPRLLRLRGGAADPLAAASEDIPARPGGVVIVQGTGDPAALREALASAGARILAYLPDGAWLVRSPTTPTNEL